MSKAQELAVQLNSMTAGIPRVKDEAAALLRTQDALLRQALVAMELFVDEPHYRIEQAVKAIEEHLNEQDS